MTFDFITDWQDGCATGSAPENGSAPPLHLDPAAGKAPPHPTSGELALLVRELFAEGSLTWDQLQALSRVAELRPMLEPTLAGIPSARRVCGHRQ